jgi:hypothetical protein
VTLEHLIIEGDNPADDILRGYGGGFVKSSRSDFGVVGVRLGGRRAWRVRDVWSD